MSEIRKDTLNYQLEQQYVSFAERVNFFNYVKEAQKFYNGDQYPKVNLDNFLRVSLNICSFSSNIKASKLNGTPTYIKFTSDDENVDCLKLERFDLYNQNKLHEKQEDFQTALNGFNNGVDIVMYRWDESDTTYKGIYKGGLGLEHIDPLSFSVANPRLMEIQNQKWVMYHSDEEVAAVRDMFEGSEEDKQFIIPDDFVENVDDPTSNEINHRLVRVYTRFFKINGEVFFMCSTKQVDLFKYPHALNPKANTVIAKRIAKAYEQKKKGELKKELENIPDFDIDYEDVMIPYLKNENFSEEEYYDFKEKFSLYPIAIFVPFKINNKWYGRSDVKQLIPIQKGINFAISMILKCVENNAYQKILVKNGALKGQVITNEPSQVITDYSIQTNQWGIKALETPSTPNGVLDIVSKIFDLTRIVGGFNDVMDGSISNQDVSGYAIQQMIKQANTSIEQQQQILWQFKAEKASIRLMFYKFFVEEAKYTKEIPEYQAYSEDDARKELYAAQQQGKLDLEGAENMDFTKEVKRNVPESISNSEIYGHNFDINIEVEQGLVDSELAEAQMWDTLIMNGGIQNLSPQMLEAYITANPMVSERTKQALRGIVEKQKKELLTRYEQENKELKAMLQQAVGWLQKQQAVVDNQKLYNQNLTKEFTNKLDAQNKIINAQNQYISEGQKKSENARGVNNPSTQIQRSE